MAAALAVYVDAQQYYPKAQALRGTVSCRDIWNLAGSVQQNIELDGYSGAICCNPIQYNTDWLADNSVVRYGLSAWTGVTNAWEEATDSGGVSKWLHLLKDPSTRTTESQWRISTIINFEENCGFLVQMQLCGNTADKVDAFILEFGQWKWKLNTSGKCYLYKGTELRHVDIYTQQPVAGQFIEISIMPAANGSLAIRPFRQSGAGVVYRLPDDELPTDPDEIPTIIEAAAFAVSPLDVAIKRLQVTQLTYDETLDYALYSPIMNLPYPPLTEQTLSVDFDSAQTFGGAVAAGLWYDVVDSPFVPNGSRYTYRAIFQLTPYAKTNPIIRGLHYEFAAVDPPAMTLPADVTQDVRELVIETGETAALTECRFIIRNPATYSLFGVLNRPVKVTIGTSTLFLGMLRDPPKYVATFEGDEYFECCAQGLYRQLEAFSGNQDFEMDGQVHSDMVKLLCRIGGIADANLDIYTTTETLPDTRKPYNGETQTDDGSQLHVLPMDTPAQWVESVSEKTGWLFCDGHLGTEYVLRYIDPLVVSTTPVTTFVLYSSLDMGGTLPRARSWEATTLPPECNELHVIGCNQRGELMDACYLDLDSQNGLLDPLLRPSNWLGGRAAAAFAVDGTTTAAWLQAIALRIGADVCSRIDQVRMAGDWPDMLWTGQYVTVNDGSTLTDYRIVGLRIEFVQEITGNIIRRGEYLLQRTVA
jgi:hypothetical protein